MTALLHLTDTHIVADTAPGPGRLDTSDSLARLVRRLVRIREQIGPVDGLLVSGDLSDDGSAESYARIRTLLAPLDLPLHVIPGNHDSREPMRRAFADHLPAQGPLNWTLQVGDVVLIGLDTLIEGEKPGVLTDESLAFLTAALHSTDGAPVLLALHHPPFRCGIRFMDDIGLTNTADLCAILSAHTGPLRILCGHIHTLMVTDVAGHIALSAPSPGSSFAYDLRSDAPQGYLDLQDGCLLHRWENGFQSIRIGPVAGTGPFPFG